MASTMLSSLNFCELSQRTSLPGDNFCIKSLTQCCRTAGLVEEANM